MLRIGADFAEYRAHYGLSKRDYYGILRTEYDATTAEIEAAFDQLAQLVKPDIDKGDARAEAYMKEVHRAHEILIDPVRRVQYDEDMHVKAFHVSGERRMGQISEEARLEELRTWSEQGGERQRAKERAERRARDDAGREDWDGADADRGEQRRRRKAEAESAKQAIVRAEKERREQDERSRKRQIEEFGMEKRAAEAARKVQAATEAELWVVLEEREKAKEADEARLEQGNLRAGEKRKRKGEGKGEVVSCFVVVTAELFSSARMEDGSRYTESSRGSNESPEGGFLEIFRASRSPKPFKPTRSDTRKEQGKVKLEKLKRVVDQSC